ncbi:capsular exopolysaccharide family protein [Bacillus cereus BAG1X2-3]|uniref:non-specific protein-tyrosine kinase n=1 Tax=Bacillus cereus TaxID=1396 RepID=A0A9X7HJQ5_BACCE|nr:CpsD/CapB family tyrosine-protein kinase [Bacillus cereus]EOO23283.1 capsular exopolysaccharide family protein [Bacillus cereus BAG1X1-1]EOO42868.1 capsular exopolysaccharide family protein [Bacillus cereus BAG1X2-1]EOO56421.1 capsular exopolysaccharide family protein [Bacillus cereus BAG1X2-3]EOP00108.1 capsular exopolysaccharide family protein [Bacillus cereus BAG2O-1]PHA19196.1 capsular biosynthesis protein [Bacillus cereus]
MLKKSKTNVLLSKSSKVMDFTKEKFHQIQTSLQFSRTLDNKPLKTITVTSANKGEGKSYCVWNLGKSFAANNRRVLLVDGDLYKGTLSKQLNLFYRNGLSEILINDTHPMERVVKTEQSNLFILPSGVLPPNPIELINSNRMQKIINLLEEEFDMVIFDTPPVVLLSDSRIVGSMCNGVIVVIRSGITNKKNLEIAIELLKKANVHLVGTILNGKSYSRNEMNSYTYY